MQTAMDLAPRWHPIDITVLVICFIAMIGIGVAVARRASRGPGSYFLAGNELPWYVLGVSNASAMFDITGTMWLVYDTFVYGGKGIWGPIQKQVEKKDPSFQADRNFGWDSLNVAPAIVWQMTLVTMPLHMVLKSWKGMWISIILLVALSVVLKKTWHERIEG